MTPKKALHKLMIRENLSTEEMNLLIYEIMEGNTPDALIGALLVLLRQKGETIDEINGTVQAMIERMEKIHLSDEAIDTCGTGGDSSGTFNISTVASIIANAAGVGIAKHGNRSVSSQCGSADVLEALGIKLNLQPYQTQLIYKKTNYAFLFAPLFHPSMKSVASVRRELGIRTIFNMVGPLTNPSLIKRQLVGVYDRNLLDTYSEVLRLRKATHCLVVNGVTNEGFSIDEPNISGTTFISEIKDGSVKNYSLKPEEVGFQTIPLSALLSGNLQESVETVWAILENRSSEAKRDASIYAAGMAIYIGAKAKTIVEGIELARRVLESGKAKSALMEIIEAHESIGN